jgi:hypothetical protein
VKEEEVSRKVELNSRLWEKGNSKYAEGDQRVMYYPTHDATCLLSLQICFDGSVRGERTFQHVDAICCCLMRIDET